MKMEEALELQRKWKDNGDLPCEHSNIEKEYHIGAQTGDYVCTTCGEARWGREGFNKK
jgi:hypothetical protein